MEGESSEIEEFNRPLKLVLKINPSLQNDYSSELSSIDDYYIPSKPLSSNEERVEHKKSKKKKKKNKKHKKKSKKKHVPEPESDYGEKAYSSPIEQLDSNHEINRPNENNSGNEVLESVYSSSPIYQPITESPKIILKLKPPEEEPELEPELDYNSDSELDVESDTALDYKSKAISLIDEEEQIEEPSEIIEKEEPPNDSDFSILKTSSPVIANKTTKQKGKKNGIKRTVTRIPRELNIVLTKLINEACRRDSYGVFYEPVNEEEVPDYYTIIKEPMDFSTMKKKIENYEYSDLDAFLYDMRLVCNNAMTYNHPSTVFYKTADRILTLALSSAERERAFILPNVKTEKKEEILDVETSNIIEPQFDSPQNTVRKYKKYKKNNTNIKYYLNDGSINYQHYKQNTANGIDFINLATYHKEKNYNVPFEEDLYLNFGNSHGLAYATSLASFVSELDHPLVKQKVENKLNHITLHAHQFSNNVKRILKNK